MEKFKTLFLKWFWTVSFWFQWIDESWGIWLLSITPCFLWLPSFSGARIGSGCSSLTGISSYCHSSSSSSLLLTSCPYQWEGRRSGCSTEESHRYGVTYLFIDRATVVERRMITVFAVHELRLAWTAAQRDVCLVILEGEWSLIFGSAKVDPWSLISYCRYPSSGAPSKYARTASVCDIGGEKRLLTSISWNFEWWLW